MKEEKELKPVKLEDLLADFRMDAVAKALALENLIIERTLAIGTVREKDKVTEDLHHIKDAYDNLIDELGKAGVARRVINLDVAGDLDPEEAKEILDKLKERMKNATLVAFNQNTKEALDKVKEMFDRPVLNNIQASPFTYELDGSYQAITEHPEVVTYSTSSDGHTSEKNKSVDYSTYILKPYYRPAEAVNRLGYFETLMRKYGFKDIEELEDLIKFLKKVEG